MHIGYPQAIVLSLMASALVITMIHHGEPTRTVYNIYQKIIGISLTLGLLYWGGFFG